MTKLRSLPSQINFNNLRALWPGSHQAIGSSSQCRRSIPESSHEPGISRHFGAAGCSIFEKLWCLLGLCWAKNFMGMKPRNIWIFSDTTLQVLKFWSNSCEGRSVSGIWVDFKRTSADCGQQTTSIVWKSARNSPNSPILPPWGLLNISRKDGWRFLQWLGSSNLPILLVGW